MAELYVTLSYLAAFGGVLGYAAWLHRRHRALAAAGGPGPDTDKGD